MSNKVPDEILTLLKELLGDTSRETRIAQLQGEEAQCVADLMGILLHEHSVFAFAEPLGQQLFALLRKLVKSSGVLPQCYKLQGVQYDVGNPRYGSALSDIFVGEFRGVDVCVKAIRTFEKDVKEKMFQAIAKEAVLWAHLSHENILPFYGIYLPEKSNRICVVSPWMRTGNLHNYLKERPNDAPRLPLILDIISGLRYLHSSNIVHGDLKPKNVLISDNERALICDFGVSYCAVSTNFITSQTSNASTRWIAPELFYRDTPHPTLQSDVWSFACVCYQVFTLNVPFREYHEEYQIYTAILMRELPANPTEADNVTSKEWELMTDCWKYEPDSRPSCEEIYSSVVGLVGGSNSVTVQDVLPLWQVDRVAEVPVDAAHACRIFCDIKTISVRQ